VDGFPEEALDFLEGLAADNSRTWFLPRKAIYDRSVRAPAVALTEELAARFPRGGAASVFRPYRDVRFSKDKTPYKTNVAGWIAPGPGEGAGYYWSWEPGQVFAAAGWHLLPPAALARYRAAVQDDRTGAALERAVAECADAGL
jgi:uncharacterized protein (TIGR02453 family)